MGEHNPGPYLVASRRGDGKGDERWALVRIPSEPGRFFRTHPCVLEVGCPHCGAPLGEPCRRKGIGRGSIVRIWHGRAVIIEPTRQRHRAQVHRDRVAAAGRRVRSGLGLDGVEVPQREQLPLVWDAHNGPAAAETS